MYGFLILGLLICTCIYELNSSASLCGMSTTPVQIVSNGNKVTPSELNGPSASANGIVINAGTTSPTVNGNGQTTASGTMFNLAKIASSEQKLPSSSVTTTPAGLGSTTHNVVCTGSVQASPSVSQQVINVSAQPRATLAPQNATGPRPAMSQPIIIPRGAVGVCYIRFIFSSFLHDFFY